MPHKRKPDSQKELEKKARIDIECHRITVVRLLAAKAAGREESGPTPEQAQRSTQRLRDVARGAPAIDDSQATKQ